MQNFEELHLKLKNDLVSLIQDLTESVRQADITIKETIDKPTSITIKALTTKVEYTKRINKLKQLLRGQEPSRIVIKADALEKRANKIKEAAKKVEEVKPVIIKERNLHDCPAVNCETCEHAVKGLRMADMCALDKLKYKAKSIS